jgi:hypothetical protein
MKDWTLRQPRNTRRHAWTVKNVILFASQYFIEEKQSKLEKQIGLAKKQNRDN